MLLDLRKQFRRPVCRINKCRSAALFKGIAGGMQKISQACRNLVSGHCPFWCRVYTSGRTFIIRWIGKHKIKRAGWDDTFLFQILAAA